MTRPHSMGSICICSEWTEWSGGAGASPDVHGMAGQGWPRATLVCGAEIREQPLKRRERAPGNAEYRYSFQRSQIVMTYVRCMYRIRRINPVAFSGPEGNQVIACGVRRLSPLFFAIYGVCALAFALCLESRVVVEYSVVRHARFCPSRGPELSRNARSLRISSTGGRRRRESRDSTARGNSRRF